MSAVTHHGYYLYGQALEAPPSRAGYPPGSSGRHAQPPGAAVHPPPPAVAPSVSAACPVPPPAPEIPADQRVDKPLAVDLFLMAHRDTTGKPILHRDVTALGLAAALLAELVYARVVTVERERVMVLRATPCDEPIADRIVRNMRAEPQALPVPMWLEYLARTAYDDVAGRLVAAGRARRVRRWADVRYQPVDSHDAAWPTARMATRLRQGAVPDAGDTALLGLVVATDLHRHVLDGMPAHRVRALRAHITGSVYPPVTTVLQHAEAFIGDTVIAGT